VVVAGIGFTAMLALAANMEHSDARKASAGAARATASTAPRTIVVVHQGAAPTSLTAGMRATHRPIVLTARPLVHTITVVASGGGSTGYSAPSGGSGSGYVSVSASGGSSRSSAPAAPVASTSGSKVH
jgi:hypothetical protein